MNTMTKLELLQLAKSLTDSNDIDQLIESSNKISNYLNDNLVTTSLTKISFVEFIKNLRIQHPIRGSIPFVPYDFQIDLAQDLETNDNIIINHSRQMGLSYLQASYALWFAMYHPNETILIVSNQLNGALEIMDRIKFIYDNLTVDMKQGVFHWNKGSIQFVNGSKIIGRAASEHSVRGLSISLLVVDQAAYISYSKQTEFWNAIQLNLVTNGRVIMTSTPNESRGLFHDVWRDFLTNGFKPVFVPWSLHPDRDQNWKDFTIRNIGSLQFSREYDCQFIDR